MAGVEYEAVSRTNTPAWVGDVTPIVLLAMRAPLARQKPVGVSGDPFVIVDTLAEFGSPYSYLSTRAKTKLEVPKDDAHEAVFRALKEARMCTLKKKRLQPRLIVELT
jgi:hypothetical protein